MTLAWGDPGRYFEMVGRSDIAASIVIATFNRTELICALLRQLADQTTPPGTFEVIVVDDGSKEDPRPHMAALDLPFPLVTVRQENQGAAAARDNGARKARGDILIIIDDDMKIPREFVAEHLAAHASLEHGVVLGHMRPDSRLAEMPIFERFHAYQLERMVEEFRRGRRPRGNELFTGNVSMRRADYLAVGGFDRSLPCTEDAELGIRLEQHGATFVFSDKAYTIHGSDHLLLEKWLRRAFNYGKTDLRIGRKHATTPDANPWRFIAMVSPVSRPFLGLSVVAPRVSQPIAKGLLQVVLAVDRAKLERLALAGTTLVFGMEYFRGVGAESGGARGALKEYRAFLRLPKGEEDVAGKVRSAWSKLVRGVRADRETLHYYQNRYQYSDDEGSMASDLVQRVGFQMMAGYRLMRFFHEAGVPLAPKVMSRAMRVLYGSDIHWEAQIADGVVIVHGMGMAISRSAKIGSGSILFQNITLAESADPVTRKVGAPTIEENVHIGPGSAIIGPVTVGAGTKLVAGSVLLNSVAPGSRVEPAPSRVVQKRAPANGPSARDGGTSSSEPGSHAGASASGRSPKD